jgi:glutamine amidotransferase-like uncharacterized protein
MNNPTIYIYNDAGVGETVLKHTIHTMNQLFSNCYSVNTLNAEQVIEQSWQEDAVLFVMPGGADLPYVRKLNGEGNSIIKNYVENGGKYLGICAGAYYGSNYVEFDKFGSMQVLGDRELSFFPDKAIGPVLAKFDYYSHSGVRAASVNTEFNEIDNVKLYYNGGGYFNNAQSYSNIKIVGTYEVNNLAAIIAIEQQKGKVILSGVHFEVDPNMLDSPNKYLDQIAPELIADNDKREELIHELLHYLEIESQCIYPCLDCMCVDYEW